MLKFSLGTLLLVVAVAAVGCAALANPTDLWTEVVIAVTLVFLFASLVAALVGQGRLRVFATGFAAVGWAYFVLTHGNAVSLPSHSLITTRSVNWVYALRRESEDGAQPESLPIGNPSAPGNAFGAPPPLDPFSDDPFGPPSAQYAPRDMHVIGHALWALILAGAGGTFALMIRRDSRVGSLPE
jgi:hypothetical protein